MIELRDKAVVIDGEPTFIYSGEVQQYRLPAELWRDRLEKCRALGLNSIGVYFGWNFHSKAPGEYDFASPDRDLGHFLDLAAELDLKVIVRPGPYVCNEWDLGGYPGWLLAEPDGGGDWRTADPRHLAYCCEWLRKVDAIIAPRQADRDGSVILYQVENEHFQGDGGFLDGLAQQALTDGITVPLVSNGGGSAYRCGSNLITDGADIYTTLWEQWRWRGWFTMLQRQLPPEAPMMILEYRAGGHPSWGQPLIDELTSPPEFMMAQTRMFIGLGANVTNFFVVAGGITPVGYGSDHNCTPYAEDGPLSHWGGLGPKAYRIRLLGELIGSLNRQLATAMPRQDLWGSDNPRVEALVRSGPEGTFFFPVNFGDGEESFRLIGPDSAVWPRDGEPLRIAPRTTQCFVADVDLGDGWKLAFCTAQIMKVWREGSRLRLVVHGADGQAGRLTVRNRAGECRLAFTCCAEVERVTGPCGDGTVELFAVSEAVAERTWFVEESEEIVPLFGNLDLVRPGRDEDGNLRAELANGQDLHLFVTDDRRLLVDGMSIDGTVRADGMTAFSHALPPLDPPRIELGEPLTRRETSAWLHGPATDGNNAWQTLPTLECRQAVLVENGAYQYRATFNVAGALPRRLAFLSLAGVEATVYLNGQKLGTSPQKRPLSVAEIDRHVEFEVEGIVRDGANQLDVVCYQLGRHNHGRPQSSGINRPVVLFDEPVVTELPRWFESPAVRRRWPASELAEYNPASFEETEIKDWQQVDLSTERSLPPDWTLDDWLSVRWYRCRCTLPEAMRGKPLFLELPPCADAWLYVNGQFHDRVNGDRTPVFNLTACADADALDLVLGLRYYHLGTPYFLTAPPKLLGFDRVIDGQWALRKGSQGECEQWLTTADDAWRSASEGAPEARLWYRQAVRIEQTETLWAPLYVELDNEWQANAIIYWNGAPIGLYSEVGPDRRFYVPEGSIRQDNVLCIAVDGLAHPPATGKIRIGSFTHLRQLKIGREE